MPKRCSFCGKPANKSCLDCGKSFCNIHKYGHICSEDINIKRVETLESVRLKPVNQVLKKNQFDVMKVNNLGTMMTAMKYGPSAGKGLLDIVFIWFISGIGFLNCLGYVSMRTVIVNEFVKNKNELFEWSGFVLLGVITLMKFALSVQVNWMILLFVQYCAVYQYMKLKNDSVNMNPVGPMSVLIGSANLKTKMKKFSETNLDIINCLVIPSTITLDISSIPYGTIFGLMCFSVKNMI